MLKKVIAALLASILAVCASSAYAAESVGIRVQNRTDGEPVAIASDVQPEIRNNRVMVPLRVIGEHLGAKVHWTDKEAVLAKGDKTITLQPDSGTAVVDGTEARLDAKPYLKENRMMVPLRFIAEAFDCDVRYENHIVTVATRPLSINGVQVKALQLEVRMTMGSVVSQIVGNSHIGAIYHAFEAGKGGKVEAPAHVTWHSALADPDGYYLIGQYDFLDRDGVGIKRHEIYCKYLPNETYPGEYLLYEVREDQWYRFDVGAVDEIWRIRQDAQEHGYWTVIRNTAV